jgi:hypothetical protein
MLSCPESYRCRKTFNIKYSIINPQRRQGIHTLNTLPGFHFHFFLAVLVKELKNFRKRYNVALFFSFNAQ